MYPDLQNQSLSAFEAETCQGLILTDTQGQILLLNQTAEALSGYTSSELLGLSVYTLIKDVPLADTLKAPLFGLEQRLRSKSGEEILVEIRSSRFLLDGEARIILLRDLRKDSPEKSLLHAHQTKINALLEAIPDSIFIQDYEGIILDYYPPVYGQFLASDTLVCGQNMTAIFPDNLIAIYREAFTSLREDRKPVQANFTWANPEPNHYEVRLVPMNDRKVLSIVREVTASVQNKLNLENEQSRLRHYLDTAASMFVVIDASYQIVLANRKTREILGFDQQKIEGLNWFDRFIPNSDREKQKILFDQIILGNSRPTEYFENEIVCQDGIRLIRWRNALLKDAQGKITGLICSGVDITARRRTEAELIESEARNRAILDAIPDLITVHDSSGKLLEFRASQSIQGMFNSHGVRINDPKGFFTDSISVAIQETAASVYESGKSKVLEFAQETRLGIKYFEARYVPLEGNRVMGVARDINQSKAVRQILELRNLALEEASDAIVISDALLPDRPVIYCNKAFTQITGYGRDEVLGKNCRFLQGADQEQEAIGRIQKAIQQAEPTREILRNYKKDGSLFWNELALTPIASSTGEVTHFIGVLRDITEKVGDENRQKGIRALLEAITADSPVEEIGAQICKLLVALAGAGAAQILTLDQEQKELIALADFGMSSGLRSQMQRISLDGEPACPCSAAAILREAVLIENIGVEPRWSDRVKPLQKEGFMACWSYPILDSNREVLGTCTLYEHQVGIPTWQAQDIIHEILQLAGVALERHLSHLKLQESNTRLEAYTEILEQSVEERTTEVKATLQQLVQTNQDLEDQINTTREAQFKARTNQRLFAAIAQNFPKGLIMVVDHNQNLLHLEGEELGLLHLDQWKYHSQPITQLPGLSDHQEELLQQRIHETLNGAHHSFDLEFLSQTYTINSTPLSVDSQPCWALMVWSNTTDQKNHEQELVRALEAQQELNDLKSRFMSMASHEFRTPLSAILTSATLIGKQQEPGMEDRRDRYVAQIQNNVRNLVVILDDFLSLSKLDEGEIACNPTTFDLKALLRKVLEEMETHLKIGQHFVEDCEPGSYQLRQDPKLTRHILLNLLSNAIKYAPENTVIELVMRRVKENIVLSVRDYGIGIPKKEQEQIFNRFFRARNAENIQGTGLGLNIVKQYTELMGGQIHFTSTEGMGSTFEIQIPITHNTYRHENDLNN